MTGNLSLTMIPMFIKRWIIPKWMSPRRKQEVLGVLMLLVALLTLTSLVTKTEQDEMFFMPGTTVSIVDFSPENSIGYVGMLFCHLAYYTLGMLSLFIPAWLLLMGLKILFKWEKPKCIKRLYYTAGIIFSISVIMALSAVTPPVEHVNYVDTLGGLLAHVIASLLYTLFSTVGTWLIACAAIVIFTSLLIEYRPEKWEKRSREWVKTRVTTLMERFRRREPKSEPSQKPETPKPSIWSRIRNFNFDFLRPNYETKHEQKNSKSSYVRSKTPPPSENFVADFEEIRDKVMKERESENSQRKSRRTKKTVIKRASERKGSAGYDFPELDLLSDNPQPVQSVSKSELEDTATNLLQTLKTFGVEVEGEKIDKYPGPVITRYEFKPGTGVKVSQIVNLADDIALSLSASKIRIVAPVPGKAAVGVEIPNRNPQVVYLKDILESDDYNDAKLKLPLALGRTISGSPFVTDLADMPHLLVAGATGAGKSVCLNVIITSLMYRHSPNSLRFLFIDPKMLELSVYQGIPHLERPVVTNSRQAERLLNDAVSEMEQRYKKLAAKNVRNIDDFNEVAEDEEKLPYIVIVVDELADLMMSSSSSRIETLITRLAQMARAVGIHLILATQRPSVDVITGLIKANFPARIAFQVASRIDSRTILDGNGAEKLLGRGDMLFLRPAQHEPVRVHGALISSGETNSIVGSIKEQEIEVQKIDNLTEEKSKKRQEALGSDPLLREAAQLVVRHKQGSVSLLQRRLGIGYQRAARLIDQLEEKKVVGPYDGSKAREVLVDQRYLEQMMDK